MSMFGSAWGSRPGRYVVVRKTSPVLAGSAWQGSLLASHFGLGRLVQVGHCSVCRVRLGRLGRSGQVQADPGRAWQAGLCSSRQGDTWQGRQCLAFLACCCPSSQGSARQACPGLVRRALVRCGSSRHGRPGPVPCVQVRRGCQGHRRSRLGRSGQAWQVTLG